MSNYKVTIFTPSYNRASTLPRLYECIKNQIYKNIEWIIVDDGSSDNTKEVVNKFIQENPEFNIIYKYQTNHGKHIATNVAVDIANGDFFITIDSDDTFKPEAIKVLVDEWDKISDAQKLLFKGISCRTCDQNNNLNGTHLSSHFVDCNDLDLRFKYKITGELWGMTRTKIMREFPYPSISGLHFYPENIHWDAVGRKYKTRFIDVALRYYINDQQNALTSSKNSSAKETFFMREHFINDCWDYHKYDRKFFLKNIVGLSRDGIASGKKFKEIIKVPNSFYKKVLTFISFPIGFVLNKK